MPAVTETLSWIPTLALAVALAAAAGLRAWLPLLATGLLGRLGVIEVAPSFSFLSSTPALVLFSVATVLEVAADKIPAVDHVLDAVSSFLRPAAGVLVAASVMWQVTDPLWALGLGLVVGAPAAAVPHALKSGARVVSSAGTGGVVNPLLSVVEDAVALSLLIMAVLAPLLAAALVGLAAFVAIRALSKRLSGADAERHSGGTRV